MNSNNRQFFLARVVSATAFTWFATLICGCSRLPAGPSFPDVDPSEAAARAIETYDRSGDGVLNAAEIAASPPLSSAVSRIDENDDGVLSAAEIQARIQNWRDSGTSLVDAMAEVTLDGRPLSNADVTFEPEGFLGTAYSTISGTTNSAGIATFAGHNSRLPGVFLGFYRVRIALKDPAGRDALPERYNDKTQLGVEITANKGGYSQFRLTSAQ